MSMLLGRRQFGLCLVSATTLAACASPPPRARFPDLTFGHMGQFRIEASRLEIVSEYQPPGRAPNIDHLFPVLPEQALRRWAQDRVAPTGTPGRYARFVIRDAKVTDTDLPRTPGVRGAFTTDQTNRYDGALSAALEIREERGNFVAGSATAMASRSRTVPEGITVNDRDKIWFEMIEQLMTDINTEFERQIRANLGQFLR